MANITVTYRDGRVSQLEQVYIRGSKIRFLILPDMLKNAPMLKSMKNKNQAAGAGRGKAAILKAQGIYSLLIPVHTSYTRNMFFVVIVFYRINETLFIFCYKMTNFVCFNVFAVAARGRGRGGPGRGNIFQKRR